jgi:hypothetical protein
MPAQAAACGGRLTRAITAVPMARRLARIPQRVSGDAEATANTIATISAPRRQPRPGVLAGLAAPCDPIPARQAPPPSRRCGSRSSQASGEHGECPLRRGLARGRHRMAGKARLVEQHGQPPGCVAARQAGADGSGQQLIGRLGRAPGGSAWFGSSAEHGPAGGLRQQSTVEQQHGQRGREPARRLPPRSSSSRHPRTPESPGQPTCLAPEHHAGDDGGR